MKLSSESQAKFNQISLLLCKKFPSGFAFFVGDIIKLGLCVDNDSPCSCIARFSGFKVFVYKFLQFLFSVHDCNIKKLRVFVKHFLVCASLCTWYRQTYQRPSVWFVARNQANERAKAHPSKSRWSTWEYLRSEPVGNLHLRESWQRWMKSIRESRWVLSYS